MNAADRELLEYAAKAAGLNITGWSKQGGGVAAVIDGTWFWQPLLKNGLTDCDGDTLRLMAKLRLNLDFGHMGKGPIDVGTYGTRRNDAREWDAGTEQESLRRAIVRAAAAIGEAMP